MRGIGILLALAVLSGCCCVPCEEARCEERSGERRRKSLHLSERDQWYLKDRAPETLERIRNGEPLSARDVIHMHQAGMLPDDMMRLIDVTNSMDGWSRRDFLALYALDVPLEVLRHVVDRAVEVTSVSDHLTPHGVLIR